jgi:hypothetical protein
MDQVRINTYDPHHPCMEIVLDGREYSWSIAGYPEEDWPWLQNVMFKLFKEVRDRYYKKGQEDAIQRIKDALNVK